MSKEVSLTGDMEHAPRDRLISCWNGFYGWYETQYEDGEWPLRDPKWPESIWYPVPSAWREIGDANAADPEQRD
jgi:hypothetical protein